jgi:hypothetical protein
MLCRCGNLSGKLQWNDNQELTAIGAHDQHVGAFQPPIKFVKSIAPALPLDPAIDAEDWHGYIAAEAPARSAGEGYAFGGKAALLQQAHDGALGARAFLP